MKYETVKCSERLPEKDGHYICLDLRANQVRTIQYSNGWYHNESVGWWLKPIEETKDTKNAEEWRQEFKDNSDCYADTGRFENDGSYSEGEVIQAITEDVFIKLLTQFAQSKEVTTKNAEEFKEWLKKYHPLMEAILWSRIDEDTLRKLYQLFTQFAQSNNKEI